MRTSIVPERARARALFVGALFVALAVPSAVGDSATFDETAHLPAGLAYLEGSDLSGSFPVGDQDQPVGEDVAYDAPARGRHHAHEDRDDEGRPELQRDVAPHDREGRETQGVRPSHRPSPRDVGRDPEESGQGRRHAEDQRKRILGPPHGASEQQVSTAAGDGSTGPGAHPFSFTLSIQHGVADRLPGIDAFQNLGVLHHNRAVDDHV